MRRGVPNDDCKVTYRPPSKKTVPPQTARATVVGASRKYVTFRVRQSNGYGDVAVVGATNGRANRYRYPPRRDLVFVGKFNDCETDEDGAGNEPDQMTTVT